MRVAEETSSFEARLLGIFMPKPGLSKLLQVQEVSAGRDEMGHDANACSVLEVLAVRRYGIGDGLTRVPRPQKLLADCQSC